MTKDIEEQYTVLASGITDLLQEVKQLTDMYQTIAGSLAVMNNDIQINNKRINECVDSINLAHDRIIVIEQHLEEDL